MFDYNKAKQEAQEEAATDKWDKARLFYEKVTFCVRACEEQDNPWYDEIKNPAPTLFSLGLAFMANGHKQTISTTYKVTPEMRILLKKYPLPWHCMRFDRYQTKSGSYGYELAQVSTDDSRCPWEAALASMQQPAQPSTLLLSGGVVEADPAEINAILLESGFDPLAAVPITDATKRKIFALVAMLKSNGVIVTPADPDLMTEQEGKDFLSLIQPQVLTVRQQWANKSVGQHSSAV